jgi:hypothetical protein
MIFTFEWIFLRVFIIMVGVMFSFKYNILYIILRLCLFIFFSISLLISLWIGVVFFLIYIGALLVLFFFVFSLKNKYLFLKGKNVYLWILLSGLVGVIKIGFLLPRRRIYNKINELAIVINDMTRILTLISFICFTVWGFNNLKRFQKFPLRPVY